MLIPTGDSQVTRKVKLGKSSKSINLTPSRAITNEGASATRHSAQSIKQELTLDPGGVYSSPAAVDANFLEEDGDRFTY